MTNWGTEGHELEILQLELWLGSHSSLEIIAQMRQYFKPETNKGEFSLYFELFEKKL